MALSDAGVTAEQAGKVKARLSQLDDGTVIYKVSFTCDGQKYSYQIGAVSGEIVDKSAEAATGDPSTASGGHGKRGGKQETAEPEPAICADLSLGQSQSIHGRKHRNAFERSSMALLE